MEEKAQGAAKNSPRDLLLKEQRAQGAIEYLLIIGAAIVVVAVVIAALTGTMTEGRSQGDQANTDYNKQVTDLNKLKRF